MGLRRETVPCQGLTQRASSQGELRKHVVQIIGHELKQKVDAVVERSEDILALIRFFSAKAESIKGKDSVKALEDLLSWFDEQNLHKRLDLLTKDLHHYIRSTHQLIEFLQDESKWATPGYHPLIHYRSLDFINT